MAFRSYEEIAPGIVANRESRMKQKMCTVYVGSTASRRCAASVLVKQQRFSASSSHKISEPLLREWMCKDIVRVVQNGPIELVVVVYRFVIAKGAFDVDTAIAIVQVLQRSVRIRATF